MKAYNTEQIQQGQQTYSTLLFIYALIEVNKSPKQHFHDSLKM